MSNFRTKEDQWVNYEWDGVQHTLPCDEEDEHYASIECPCNPMITTSWTYDENGVPHLGTLDAICHNRLHPIGSFLDEWGYPGGIVL